jgi:hypothetical protein
MIRQTDLTPGQWARFYQAEQATGRPVSELLADFVLDHGSPAPFAAPSPIAAYMA